ncbi:S24 family peptidase [Aerococcus urinaeequi]
MRSGQIGVFIIDNESYLKKAYIEDNHLRLVSLNTKYVDLIFDDVNEITVVGTVVM